MGEPLRHRQTKGAANRHARPTATAPHSDSTDLSGSMVAPRTTVIGRKPGVQAGKGEPLGWVVSGSLGSVILGISLASLMDATAAWGCAAIPCPII